MHGQKNIKNYVDNRSCRDR